MMLFLLALKLRILVLSATAANICLQGRMGFIMNGLWTVAALQDVDFDWGIAEMWEKKKM